MGVASISINESTNDFQSSPEASPESERSGMAGVGGRRETMPHTFIGHPGGKLSRGKILLGAFSGPEKRVFFRAKCGARKKPAPAA
jgi:hypothetical protein